ncbi:hypothetical protein [Sulfobacillus harzensis]|uniref:Type II secretion system protein GspF domain-containing protein n=1 Tax=Sulfobacillus harzensis TaxID=2729629 RepID=A0A7Y0Q4Y4_9FIRM|nr:hypothetical protein [Sulfobacillus harzensis]NMP24890.1 hypothetical protein [Sulfobacillus harzensis]
MSALVGAVAASVAVFCWLKGWSGLYPAVGWALGLAMRDDAAMMAGLVAGVGLAALREAERFESRRDGDEFQALMLLERLRQLWRVRGTLAGALDEMGYRSRRRSPDAAEQVLAEVADALAVRSLSLVAKVAGVVRRHGGDLDPLLAWGTGSIQEGQARRYARQVEEQARRASIKMLALAPVGVVGVFRLLVPSFYHALATTWAGDLALWATGATTAAATGVLSWQVRKEARVR